MEVAGAERAAAVRGRAAHPTVVEHEPVRQVAARLLRKLACGRRTPLGGSVEFRVACSLIRKEAPPALSTLERLHPCTFASYRPSFVITPATGRVRPHCARGEQARARKQKYTHGRLRRRRRHRWPLAQRLTGRVPRCRCLLCSLARRCCGRTEASKSAPQLSRSTGTRTKPAPL